MFSIRSKVKKCRLQDIASWILVIITVAATVLAVIFSHASATTSGKMTLYFHKEASDVNETYNSLSLTPDESAADTAPATLTSTTNVNATPPTSFCEAADTQTDAQNERVASAASTGNRCLGTFISMPVGNAISMSTGDTNAITSQLWSSESASQAAVALNVYLYRCSTTCISSSTLTSTDRIATLTCAEPGTSATTCSVTAAPANNITFVATDRIVAVVSSNVTTLRSGANTSFYFDSTGRTETSVSLQYTALAYNTTNKPTIVGGASLDDDFSGTSSTAACSTSGVTVNSKWTCLQGTAANTAGATNYSSDSSNWLWLSNQTTSTSATTSNFGTTPSNTFLYQSMPSSYGDGNIRTALNSTATFGVGASTPTTPFNHMGLVLWTSNTDYLELQVYSTGATTGTNSIDVAVNNSGTIGTATSLNASTTAGIFGEIWLGFSNTGNSWQGQYSTDGTTWNNVGSAVSHNTIFTRVGLNAFTKISNPVSTYAGAFEWFSYGLANPSYTQTSFRWDQNADQANPTTALAANNTAFTLTSSGQQIRLRQSVKANANVGILTSNSYSIKTVDSSANVGSGPSIALDGNGNPSISYYDVTNSSLKFAECTSYDCSTLVTPVTVDNNEDDGNFSSMKLGSDGFARISYYDATNTALKFVQCTNADCSTHSTPVTVDSGGVGSYISTAIASDGFARISYYDATNTALKFVQCTNADCSTHSTPVTVDNSSSSSDGSYNSLALGSDGFGRIAYTSLDSGFDEARFIQCTNADCSTKATASIVDSSNAGVNISMALGSDGFGRMSYYSFTNNGLIYAQCTNASCSTHSTPVIIDAGSTVGEGTSLAIGSDGYARIAYLNITGGVIRYVACTTDDCSSHGSSIQTITGTTVPALALRSGDFAAIAYYGSSHLNTETQRPPFKLQYSQASVCSSATYTDVSSSTPIAFYDNPTPADNDPIATNASTDPSEAGQTYAAQTYKEGALIYNTSRFGYTVNAEWDISVYDNGAPASTTYCLRLTKGDGTALTYTNYPQLTTFSSGSGPTTDQLLRGGQYFSGGSKQPYFWAN